MKLEELIKLLRNFPPEIKVFVGNDISFNEPMVRYYDEDPQEEIEGSFIFISEI